MQHKWDAETQNSPTSLNPTYSA